MSLEFVSVDDNIDIVEPSFAPYIATDEDLEEFDSRFSIKKQSNFISLVKLSIISYFSNNRSNLKKKQRQSGVITQMLYLWLVIPLLWSISYIFPQDENKFYTLPYGLIIVAILFIPMMISTFNLMIEKDNPVLESLPVKKSKFHIVNLLIVFVLLTTSFIISSLLTSSFMLLQGLITSKDIFYAQLTNLVSLSLACFFFAYFLYLVFSKFVKNKFIKAFIPAFFTILVFGGYSLLPIFGKKLSPKINTFTLYTLLENNGLKVFYPTFLLLGITILFLALTLAVIFVEKRHKLIDASKLTNSNKLTPKSEVSSDKILFKLKKKGTLRSLIGLELKSYKDPKVLTFIIVDYITFIICAIAAAIIFHYIPNTNPFLFSWVALISLVGIQSLLPFSTANFSRDYHYLFFVKSTFIKTKEYILAKQFALYLLHVPQVLILFGLAFYILPINHYYLVALYFPIILLLYGTSLSEGIYFDIKRPRLSSDNNQVIYNFNKTYFLNFLLTLGDIFVLIFLIVFSFINTALAYTSLVFVIVYLLTRLIINYTYKLNNGKNRIEALDI